MKNKTAINFIAIFYVILGIFSLLIPQYGQVVFAFLLILSIYIFIIGAYVKDPY